MLQQACLLSHVFFSSILTPAVQIRAICWISGVIECVGGCSYAGSIGTARQVDIHAFLTVTLLHLHSEQQQPNIGPPCSRQGASISLQQLLVHKVAEQSFHQMRVSSCTCCLLLKADGLQLRQGVLRKELLHASVS